LRVLKAQLNAGGELATGRHSFGKLYELLAGKSDSTDEYTRRAEFGFGWELAWQRLKCQGGMK
jgi:hypothetical protein